MSASADDPQILKCMVDLPTRMVNFYGKCIATFGTFPKWFQLILGMFTPKRGEMIQFDERNDFIGGTRNVRCDISLVFEIPYEDRCLDPRSHLLRRRRLGVPFTPILTIGMTGGFWKTRV